MPEANEGTTVDGETMKGPNLSRTMETYAPKKDLQSPKGDVREAW